MNLNEALENYINKNAVDPQTQYFMDTYDIEFIPAKDPKTRIYSGEVNGYEFRFITYEPITRNYPVVIEVDVDGKMFFKATGDKFEYFIADKWRNGFSSDVDLSMFVQMLKDDIPFRLTSGTRKAISNCEDEYEFE